MKCPKCDYLGFETGDRCKNCGYDFSLIAAPGREAAPDLELSLQPPAAVSPDPRWFDRIDAALGRSTPAGAAALSAPEAAAAPAAVAPPVAAAAPGRFGGAPRALSDARLPLFMRAGDEAGDEPLVKVPAAPRPPLAVRRTPEGPRLRAVPRPAPPAVREPELEFSEEPMPVVPQRARPAAPPQSPGPAGARLAAAVIDHGVLLAVDAAVVYLTLRMAGLATADWALLPVAPLLAFLLLLKLSYFCAFTAVGGQTIGKMAARIRVVTQEGAPIDSARAVRRTLAGALSASIFGLGFVPALLDTERRALHDRLTHTRVVAL